jgi:hypothetical protein
VDLRSRDALQFMLIDVSTPFDPRAKQTVQCDIAGCRRRRLPGEHQHHLQPETGASSCREPGMVALRRTGRDQGARFVGEGRGAGVFEFSDLVDALRAVAARGLRGVLPAIVRQAQVIDSRHWAGRPPQ